MAGIYIHIPFCKSRCIYCGFYSTTGLSLRQRYVDAVVAELSQRPSRNTGTPHIETIYLGGGTPSQLDIAQLRRIFEAIYRYNRVTDDAEITIEVNPDDVTHEFAKGLRELPVNRVSMGAQTFSDERLRFLHRRHTAGQVGEAILRLRDVGITNISIDLMYGFPGETLAAWEADIHQALSLDVEHLSAYSLMYEEGTTLHRQLRTGSIEEINEELARQMYDTLIDQLTVAGFEHYELSNFARPGFRSRHNSSYWTGIPYIGIGAAAHSYDIRSRSWNVSDIRLYIEGMERGERPFEEELIDDDTHYNDTVTVALRTREGLDLSQLSEKHKAYCLENAQRFIEDGLLKTDGIRLVLTRKGLFVSDMVMSELIWI